MWFTFGAIAGAVATFAFISCGGLDFVLDKWRKR